MNTFINDYISSICGELTPYDIIIKHDNVDALEIIDNFENILHLETVNHKLIVKTINMNFEEAYKALTPKFKGFLWKKYSPEATTSVETLKSELNTTSFDFQLRLKRFALSKQEYIDLNMAEAFVYALLLDKREEYLSKCKVAPRNTKKVLTWEKVFCVSPEEVCECIKGSCTVPGLLKLKFEELVNDGAINGWLNGSVIHRTLLATLPEIYKETNPNVINRALKAAGYQRGGYLYPECTHRKTK